MLKSELGLDYILSEAGFTASVHSTFEYLQ
jgi:hypothetical protein